MIYKSDILADLHVHTSHSIHAYSTLRENLNMAERRNLKYIAITDHFFRNTMYGEHEKQEISRLKTLNGECAREYNSCPDDKIGIISGVELNFNHQCIYPDVINTLGIRLAGFHSWFMSKEECIHESGSVIAHVEKCMNEMPFDILCHPERDLGKLFDNEKDKFEYLTFIVEYAKKHNKILELNAGSFYSYGIDEDIMFWLSQAKSYNVMLSIGSDAHVDMNVGRIDFAVDVLNLLNIPIENIVNADERWLKNHAIPHHNG